jgi:predicted CoA-binding protein
LSIITPPAVTLRVLEDAKSLGFKNIWIQPGGEDQKVREFANENTDIDIILGGPCILVDGPSLLKGKL